MSIELGYAPLALPSGRRPSVVDVPGHERFVRTMVAGATGVDLYLMAVAADDGVMPQTREHAAVLAALGVTRGVIAITKADRAAAGRSGPPSCTSTAAFAIRGAGTVVTGTLWSGAVAHGDTLVLQPAGRTVRVRSVQVHDAAVRHAAAGQRVALNLAGVALREVRRGDALVAAGAPVAAALVLDCALQLRGGRSGARVQVHHGTRDVAARLVALGAGLWQLRLEQPLLAAGGDRLVVRSVTPPDTLGGGTGARRARAGTAAAGDRRAAAAPRAGGARAAGARRARRRRRRAAGAARRRRRSRSPACATSSGPRASMRRRCWSTSTRHG
jgi:selenocysteine-specific elongation factor